MIRVLILRQSERKNVRAGGDGDVLTAVDRVADRRRGDQIPCIEMPERLASARVERRDLSLVLAREDDPAGGGQHAGAVMEGTDLLVVPHLFPSRGVDSADEELPRLFRLGTFKVP